MVLIRGILGFINNYRRRTKITILICIPLIFLLSGCEGKNKDQTESISSQKTVDVDNYIKIYNKNTGNDGYMFYYDIFDTSGNIVKHDCTYMDEPIAVAVSQDIIKLSVQSGTGKSTRYTYYYDFEKNRLSKEFYYVLCEKEEIVVSFSKNQIVMADMFDKDKVIKNITLKKNLSPCVDPIVSASFSNDLKKITVVYLSGTDFKKISETISI